MSALRRLTAIAVAVIVCAVPGHVLAQDAPTVDEVLIALQDVDVTLDGLQVRSAMANEAGGNALLQLADGTLIDLRLVEVPTGWSVRDITLVAGNADSYRTWSDPWRGRVDAAENFLASVDQSGEQRAAEELAPLSWFEDPDESSRLWGMNPVTYRMMQTLQMMPTLTGPMGAGSATNPVPRRNDQ